MKVNQIVNEHKKGVRAKIYNKKATVKAQGAIPLYGPDKQEAKLTPYKPKKIDEAEVTLKPLAGAQEVDIDGKPVGTATTPEAATAIKDMATKGEFTPASADGTAPKPMEETGEDEDLPKAKDKDDVKETADNQLLQKMLMIAGLR